jgi:16S rRNA processing protein RimM
MSEFQRVGRIVNTHGLKGQVKVEVLTDFDERLAQGRRLRLRDQWVTVEASQWQRDRMLVKLSGVDHIDDAKQLQWEYLLAAPEDLVLDEDEFMVDDLVGLNVVTAKGKSLGCVDSVEAYPAQDILVIGELMIPFVHQFVKSVDVEKKVITVELVEGMLEERD